MMFRGDNSLKIQGIIWLDDIIDKLATKHNVRQNEVSEVFSSQPYFRFVEKGHRSGENVYAALGQTKNGRYLIVFFTPLLPKGAVESNIGSHKKVFSNLFRMLSKSPSWIDPGNDIDFTAVPL